MFKSHPSPPETLFISMGSHLLLLMRLKNRKQGSHIKPSTDKIILLSITKWKYSKDYGVICSQTTHALHLS